MKREHICIVIAFIVSGITGCGMGGAASDKQAKQGQPQIEQVLLEETESIAESYREIYENAVEKECLGSLDVTGKIVERLGNQGYAAVDFENEIDMANPELAEAFCRLAKEKKEGKLLLLTVMDNGGFVRYDLETSQGEMKITRSILNWKDGEPQAGYLTEYPAYTWNYTEKGYLFFEEYHPSGFDGPSGHTAIRVKPLDSACREWNRKCLEPIGYGSNNMFIADWNESNFQNLNFYDLYEPLYQMYYGRQVPLDFDFGKVRFEIPGKEFGQVFTAFFQVDSRILRQKMIYHEETDTYQYRARCIYDCGSGTEVPYPEVTSFEENADGTVKLMAEAVWPKKNMDCAFSHEVIVRPLENGEFQYMSNRVIPSETNVEPVWYRERLSEEEWEEHYGGTE